MSDAPSTASAYPAIVDPAAVSITFELERNELPRLWMFIMLRRTWPGPLAMFVVLLGFQALMLLAPQPIDWLTFTASPVGFSLVGLVALAGAGWNHGTRLRDTMPVYQNAQTFVFTPGKVTHRGKGMETTFDLAGCHGVSESATHFTIWVTFASAYFVPLRAFANAEQVAQVRVWFRAGMPGTAKIKLRG